MNKTILVAGASGITGSYIANAFRQPGEAGRHRVLTLSRGSSSDLQVDLTDRDSIEAVSDQLGAVTHLFYCAFAGSGGGAGWASLTAVNTAMLTSLMDVVRVMCPSLQRVVLMQGQKVYGTHLGPFKTPAKESDPRHAGENFYFTQQDLLTELSAQQNWDYLCLRPHIVCGHNDRAPQNPVMVLSRYAYLLKQADRPLDYPGPADAFRRLNQATDANLLARAALWSVDADGIDGESFNIINGDYFRWLQVWPILADVFGMTVGEVVHQDLAQTMPPLERQFLPGRVSPDWAFANYMLGCTWDVMACTLKARRYGFNGFSDSQQMYRLLFEQARNRLVANPA